MCTTESGGYEDRMSANTPTPNPEKDPRDWVTGDEPMTGPQSSYLQTLAHEAGERVPDDLTKAEASETIDRLQAETGRGQPDE
jgi:hypothetical protein